MHAEAVAVRSRTVPLGATARCQAAKDDYESNRLPLETFPRYGPDPRPGAPARRPAPGRHRDS